MTVIDFFFQSLFKLNHLTSLLYRARPNARVSPGYPIIVVMVLRVHTVAQAKQSRKEISGKSVFLYFAAWGTHVGRVSGVFPSAQISGCLPHIRYSLGSDIQGSKTNSILSDLCSYMLTFFKNALNVLENLTFPAGAVAH